MNCDNLIGEEIAVTSEIKRPDFVNRFRMCASCAIRKLNLLIFMVHMS